MAIFRNIQMSFWTDPKIADDFSPEDKYFYLYLMTNPHTNICGCYEISLRQIADETGYTKDKVEKLLSHLEKDHKVIAYSKESREVLLINWHKYNWTSSEKFRVPLGKTIQSIKNDDFKAFLMDMFNGIDNVSIPYTYPIDTNCIDTTITITDTITDTVTDIKDTKKVKRKYGTYQNVLLTDQDMEKLKAEFPTDYEDRIERVSLYCKSKGKTYSDYLATIRNWARKENNGKSESGTRADVESDEDLQRRYEQVMRQLEEDGEDEWA